MALVDAILADDLEKVKESLQGAVDVNELDQYGYPPLVEAAIVNNADIASALLEAGANVNSDDLIGSTALQWAVDNNNLDLAKLLLDNGANPNSYTLYGQPPLVKPLLRHQAEIKELLYHYGADLKFAQDYINAKLLGHRFEMEGRNYILTTEGKYIEMNFEGFVIEFTIAVILNSLMQFKNNYAARRFRNFFYYMQHVIEAFMRADEMLRYQNYLINIGKHRSQVNKLFCNDLLLLPVGYAGHAVSFIKCGPLFAKCDRGEMSLKGPSVAIYHVTKKRKFNMAFLQHMIYEKQNKEFIEDGFIDYLGCELVMTLPLPSQVTGNCSWANMEAAIPTIMMCLMIQEHGLVEAKKQQRTVSMIFRKWREWDKDRSLHQMIESFYQADDARRAAMASIFAAALVQKIDFRNDKDLQRANKILTILRREEYKEILDSYLKIYDEKYRTKIGKNLQQLLDIAT